MKPASHTIFRYNLLACCFILKFNAHAKFDNSSTIQDYDSSAKSSAKSYSNHDQHSNDRDYTYFQSKAYERQIRSQIQQNRKKSATQKFIKIKKTKMSSANRSKTVQQFHKTIEQRFKTHKIDNFKACPAYQQGYSKRMPRNKVYDIYKKDFGGASSRVTQLLMHQSYLSIGENGNVGTVKVWRDEGVSTLINTTRIKYNNRHYDILQSVSTKSFLCMKRNGRVFTAKPDKFRLPSCLWNIHINSDHMRTIYNHNCCSKTTQQYHVETKSFKTVNYVGNGGRMNDRLRRDGKKGGGNTGKNSKIQEKRSVFETRKLYDRNPDKNGHGSLGSKNGSKKGSKHKPKSRKSKYRPNRKKRIRENLRKHKIRQHKIKQKTPKIPTMATPPPAQIHETLEFSLCRLQMDATSRKIKNGKAKSGGEGNYSSRLRNNQLPGWFFEKK